MDVQDTGFAGLEGPVLRLLPAGVSDRGRNGEMHAIEVVAGPALRTVSIGIDRNDRILGIGRAAGSVARRRLDGEGLVDIAVRVRRHVHRALPRLVERTVRGDNVAGEIAAGVVVAGRLVSATAVRGAE